MKLKFNLEYQTRFGEEIVLNVLSGDKTTPYTMCTVDGMHWWGEVSLRTKPATLEYYYSVRRSGDLLRHEWMVMLHRLDLSSVKATHYVTYDHWNDLPEDSYLYSSAFTDCVCRRQRSDVPVADYSRTVQLKVRAPQLQATQHLAIVGSVSALGNWDIRKAVPMHEHKFNEWAVALDVDALSTKHFEFKFVVFNGFGDSEPLWEEGDNRSVSLPDIAAGEVVAYELPQAFFGMRATKLAGTVVPIFSLRSKSSFGVGDFGDLKKMIDWVANTNQRVLQVLPINDTTITKTWVDSYPYNSISIYALHPQYVDLNQLPRIADEQRMEYYAKLQAELNALPQIDYERVNAGKMEYLREIFAQEGELMMKSDDFKTFFANNKQWLVPYAAFCHYRDLYKTATFSLWPDHNRFDESERTAMSNPRTKAFKEVAFWFFVQFCLDRQMRAAHRYAREHHVILKGDIPIGISRDGVEAWVEPRYFNLNGQAGAPPDAFSTNGQNWGFPTYNWDEMLSDGCAWWVRRFSKMAEYFDAYRIDHVLGFFRIWEIPINAVHGLLGQFSPALGMSREEIEGYGLNFQEDLMTQPFITDWVLDRVFGGRAGEVKEKYLEHMHDDMWRMRTEYNTQRKIEKAFKDCTEQTELYLRDGLYALISDVLFVRDRKNKDLFHPRIAVQLDFIYETLYEHDKQAFNRLYNDYYYRRNNDFWYNEAMKKLPKLVEATRMLVCAEDLGMVPDCVPWVMNELRILSLEIQSMPKDTHVRFGQLNLNPYRSVSTISTHDMSTLRQWWDEDYERAQDYYNSVMWKGGPAPHPMPGWLASDIVRNHLNSPSMLCLLSLQDWLATDEQLRLPDADAERINIPANPRHYWRYRMHINIEDLIANNVFNNQIKEFVAQSGRK